VSDITPGDVAVAFWRWFWVGVGALALLAALIVGCWQAGWWFQSHDATRQAENTQNGYSNQTTLRAQITSQLATVDSLTTQIAEAAGDQSLITALKPQRMAVAGIVCGDAAQISGTPLPAQQAQWVSANCSDGTVSPGSTYYQAGQP
jgi:hypothetical protein